MVPWESIWSEPAANNAQVPSDATKTAQTRYSAELRQNVLVS